MSRCRPARRSRSITAREEGPVLAVRVQELFGLDKHPTIAGGRVPLILHLLSPAQRPIQITRDLPGFWRGSWAAVRADMRGQYPKHPWPEDPLTAPPTRRAKPPAGRVASSAGSAPRMRFALQKARAISRSAVARLSAIGMS